MRVLFIEDSGFLHKPVAKALKNAGYTVDSAQDGKDGLWKALNSEPDVIILDLMLPGLSGQEILAKLREEENNEVSILILSSRDSIEDKVEGLSAGADDYMVKPFALAELVARVDSLVRRKYNRKATKIHVDDLCLDLASRTISRAGVEISLQARQYALLEYLILRKGEVVSRTEISEHVYDHLEFCDSNAIDVAICALRKKISVSPDSKPLIHTRRGQGYIITAPDE